jgi:hypothetical protein
MGFAGFNGSCEVAPPFNLLLSRLTYEGGLFNENNNVEGVLVSEYSLAIYGYYE